MYNAAYKNESLVLLTWMDEGLLHIMIWCCEEGSRQGCVLGTATFAATAQDVFEICAVAFPHLHLAAIVDDLLVNVPPQPDEASWQKAYIDYVAFWHLYSSEWLKRGGRVVKAALLLPPHAPAPPAGLFPPEIRLTWEGITILGGDLGTPTFRSAQAEKEVDATQWLLDRLSELRSYGNDRHYVSWKMAIKCINNKMHHYVRVNPPCGYPGAIARHDRLISDHNSQDLLLDDKVAPHVSEARRERADAILAQPPSVSAASMGRIRLSDVASAAFCAGALDAAASPYFFERRAHLAPACEAAHADVLLLLQAPDPATWPERLASRLPATASDLTEGDFAHTLLLKFNKTRVQGSITQSIMQQRLKTLDARNSVTTFKASQGSRADLTAFDAIAYHVTRHRSIAGHALNCTIRDPKLSFSGKHFVAYVRFALLLPQLLSGAREPLSDAITDTEQDTCRLCQKEAPLEPFAIHPFSCSGTVAAVTRLHNDCVASIYGFAMDHTPDLKPKYEPSAPYLMNPQYTESECALLFHGDATNPSRALAAQLRTFIDLRNAARPHNRHALAHLAAQKTSELRLFLIARRETQPTSRNQCARRRHKSNGVRPDLALWGHSPKPSELWIDHTGCHDHSTNYALTDKTLACLHEAELLATTCPLHWNPRPVPAMVAKAREKHNRFGPMADAAADAHKNGNRLAKPTVIPFVLSTRGSLNKEGHDLIRDLVAAAVRPHHAHGPARDGVDHVTRARTLRRRLLERLMVAHARGVGRILAISSGISL